MMKCQVVMEAMERIAPERLAEHWDNPGLLLGSPAQEIHRILIALDVNDDVIDKAIRERYDMIISHHPILFRGMKQIRTDAPDGKRIAQILKHDIAVFAAHTNLDIATGGVNDILATALQLQDVSPLSLIEATPLVKSTTYDPQSLPKSVTQFSVGRVGRLSKPMEATAFATYVGQKLQTPYVRLVRAGVRAVKTVGLCSGSGAEYMKTAARLACDAYVTGDLKYHEAQSAIDLGMHIVDAGHFATERIMEQALKALLEAELKKAKGSVEIDAACTSVDVFTTVSCNA